MDIEKKPAEYRRDPEDFATLYANNAVFESTFWDLKITFGQTDVALGPNIVIQHTAMTMPWPYIKILAYLLQVQIAAREAEDGHINVPTNILPPPPDEASEELIATAKHPNEQLAAIHKLWKAFLSANPEMKK